ncbi:hypothetical protein ILYODFUR_031435, partial [Ilyodon furcidens]
DGAGVCRGGRVREQGTLGSCQNGCRSLKKLVLFVIFSRQQQAGSLRTAIEYGPFLQNLWHAAFLYVFAYSCVEGNVFVYASSVLDKKAKRFICLQSLRF